MLSLCNNKQRFDSESQVFTSYTLLQGTGTRKSSSPHHYVCRIAHTTEYIVQSQFKVQNASCAFLEKMVKEEHPLLLVLVQLAVQTGADMEPISNLHLLLALLSFRLQE